MVRTRPPTPPRSRAPLPPRRSRRAALVAPLPPSCFRRAAPVAALPPPALPPSRFPSPRFRRRRRTRHRPPGRRAQTCRSANTPEGSTSRRSLSIPIRRQPRRRHTVNVAQGPTCSGPPEPTQPGGDLSKVAAAACRPPPRPPPARRPQPAARHFAACCLRPPAMPSAVSRLSHPCCGHLPEIVEDWGCYSTRNLPRSLRPRAAHRPRRHHRLRSPTRSQVRRHHNRTLANLPPLPAETVPRSVRTPTQRDLGQLTTASGGAHSKIGDGRAVGADLGSLAPDCGGARSKIGEGRTVGADLGTPTTASGGVPSKIGEARAPPRRGRTTHPRTRWQAIQDRAVRWWRQ